MIFSGLFKYTPYFLFACSVSFLGLTRLSAQQPDPPTTTNDTICGAGPAVLRAQSDLDGTDGLMYNWYRDLENPVLIKSIESGTFITPDLISSESFGVSISLNGEESEVATVRAVVTHTAQILEAPKISLCDSVTLHASANFTSDDLDLATFQWQRYEAKSDEEGTYQDINDTASNEGLNFVTKKAGFYRIVITREDGCKAISAGIEVTEENIIDARIDGTGNICFIQEPGEAAEEQLTSVSGRSFTEYLWEESTDGVSFTEISTDSAIVITNPTPDDQDSSTLYYRLTLTEQTCSKTVTDTVVWIRSPEEPEITRLGSTDDFFYCGTDDEGLRTLKVDGDPGTVSLWQRYQDPDFNISYHRDFVSSIDPLTTDPVEQAILDGFKNVEFGDSLVIDQDEWGLYRVISIDTLTECANYSNTIFAETAIAIINGLSGICVGIDTTVLSSYQTADNYIWEYSTSLSGPYSQIADTEEIEVYPPDTQGEGWYRLQVTKNGCTDESEPLFLEEEESLDLTGTEDTTFLSICDGESIVLSTITQDTSKYSFYWYNVDKPDSLLSSDSVFIASVEGIYNVRITSTYCSLTPYAPIELEVRPLPSVKLDADTSKLCGPVNLSLSNPHDTIAYQWFYSTDGNDFSPITTADSSSYFVRSKGFYYLEATSTNECSADSETIDVMGVTGTNLNTAEDTISICGGFTEVLLRLVTEYPDNEYVWQYSTDDITYVDAAGTNNEISYSASQEGYYKVLSSDGPCSEESQTVFVQINNELNPTFNAEIEGEGLVCIGTQNVFHSSYKSESAEYTWYYSTDNSTYSVLENETSDSLILNSAPLDSLISGSLAAFYLQLEVNDSSCFSTSEPFDFTLYRHTNPVLADAGSDDLCGPITLEVLNEDPGSDYQWFHSSDEVTFTSINGADSSAHRAMTAGYYYVQSTSPGGCSSISESMQVSGITASEIQIFGDTATICGSPVIELRISSYPNNKHLWFYSTDGTNFSPANEPNDLLSYKAAEEGYYKVQTIDGPCESETPAVFVQIDTDSDAVSTTISGEQVLCFGSEGLFASEELISESAGYEWYYSFDEVSYFSLENEVNDTLRLDTEIFAADIGDSLQVSLQLAVSDSSCVTLSEPYPFVVYNSPGGNAISTENGLSSFFTCDTTALGGISVQTDTELSLTYQWQFLNQEGDFENIESANQNTFEPEFAGRFRCLTTVENTACSDPTNEVVVRTLPQKIDYVGNTFCLGDTIRIAADRGLQPLSSISGFTYNWFVSNDGETYSEIDNSNNYLLTVLPDSPFYGSYHFFFLASHQGCFVTSDTLDLTVTEIPSFTYEATNPTCEGVSNGSLLIEFEQDFSGGFMLQDTLYQTTNLFDSLSDGTYWVDIISTDGCRDRFFFELENKTEPTITINTENEHIRGLPFDISASGGQTYHWYPDEYFGNPQGQSTYVTIPETFGPDSVFLFVEAVTEDGCQASASVQVALSDVGHPTFSKFFSPNGDGQNDYFEIVGLNEQIDTHLQILDNWGKVVYETENYRNQSSQSEAMNRQLKEGVYFYLFKTDDLMLQGSFYVKK